MDGGRKWAEQLERREKQQEGVFQKKLRDESLEHWLIEEQNVPTGFDGGKVVTGHLGKTTSSTVMDWGARLWVLGMSGM